MRTYINTQVAAVDQKINIHVAEDRIMHATIKESLDRIESKLDRREKRDVKREHDDD